MTETALVETRVAGEERRTGQLEQKGNDFLVLNSPASYIVTNMANRNPPVPQQKPLILDNVLV